MVTVTNDQVDEPEEEKFKVTLSNPANADLAGGETTATATGTITDNDAEPTLTIKDAEVSEGGGGMRFAVQLSGESAQPVTVAYASADVTARAGADYTPVGGTLAFAAGTTERTIEVPITDDALDEPEEEQFKMKLSTAEHATLAVDTATGTITDNDAEPTLTIKDAEVSEGDGSMRFAVQLDAASGRLVTVAYATTDGTATAGADYAQTGGTLTFAAQTTEHTIAVPITDDGLNEDNEIFTVTLSGARNATLAVDRATGTITDEDAEPELTIEDASLGEGGGTMRFSVTLNGASVQPVTVAYATADVTATARSDYTAANGTLTFTAVTPVRTIAVRIADDEVDEDGETFTVTLSDARHATLAVATATGTITDDDTRSVQVQPSALTLYVGRTARYTVALTSRPTAPVTVALTEVPAAAGVSVTPAELTFAGADWTTVRTVTVTAAETAMVGAIVTIGHTVSGGDYQGAPASSVTVTIAELTPLELESLQVESVARMYPDFAADVHHYAARCINSATVKVDAQAARSSAQLTLLRADPDDNHVSTTGNLVVDVDVNEDHDLAVELSDTDGTVTYVVHCIPWTFPDIEIPDADRGRVRRSVAGRAVGRIHRHPGQQRSTEIPP